MRMAPILAGPANGIEMSIELFLQSVKHHWPCQEGVLDGENLSGLRLQDGMVLSTSFRGANFAGSDLAGMMFQGCDFTGASFDEATVAKSMFMSCQMADTHWRHASFNQCGLMGCNLARAD